MQSCLASTESAARGTITGILLCLFAAGCAAPQARGVSAPNAACAADPAHWARGPDGCATIQSYGPEKAGALVVVLHGDVSNGGPANYHRSFAQQIAERLPGTATVALVRPGYPDGDGRTSDGDANDRVDHYTRANIALVADAIADLRRRAGAGRVVAVGHSGGAATAADILALHPGVLDGAILLACPCDIAAWRITRRPWGASVSPISVADQVPPTARVAAYTGTADTNTLPSLAESYIGRLKARGIDARFVPVPNASHNGVVNAVWNTDFQQVLQSFATP